MVWVFVPCCVISCPSSCFPSLVISFTCPWWATCVISLQVFPLSAFGPCTILVFVFGLKLSFSFSSCLSACLAIGSSLFDIRDSKRRSKRDTDVEGDSNGEKTGVLFSVIWRDPAALCLIFFFSVFCLGRFTNPKCLYLTSWEWHSTIKLSLWHVYSRLRQILLILPFKKCLIVLKLWIWCEVQLHRNGW